MSDQTLNWKFLVEKYSSRYLSIMLHLTISHFYLLNRVVEKHVASMSDEIISKFIDIGPIKGGLFIIKQYQVHFDSKVLKNL